MSMGNFPESLRTKAILAGRFLAGRLGGGVEAKIPVLVKKTLLFYEPWPCNPVGKSALQPLIWCFRSLSFHSSSALEECFFSDTGRRVVGGQAAASAWRPCGAHRLACWLMIIMIIIITIALH